MSQTESEEKHKNFNFRKRKVRFYSKNIKSRFTFEGEKKNRETAKLGMGNIRSTPEGKENDRLLSEKIRSTRNDEEEERIRNLPFPPQVTDDDEKRCIEIFCKAISPGAMKTREYDICGIAIKEGEFSEIEMNELPNKELLTKDNRGNQDCLPEYLFDIDIDSLPSQLQLSPGGFDENHNVICCKTCSSNLKKEKLPKFSIANNFQIGKTPPELTGLTLA